ncbi:MAG: HNH endonuclease [Pseudomonadota bacterium]
MDDFQIRLRRRGIKPEEILEDLQRVAKEHATETVTRLLYDQYGAFGATTVIRHFGSWNSAVDQAGLKFANRQDISNEELFENLANLWTRLGRQPYARQMSDKSTGSKFSTGTYEKRFGSWNEALMAFAKYVAGSAASDALNQKSFVPKTGIAEKRTARDVNWRLRAKILIRDACICQMCGASPAKDPEVVLHVDHIVPWSKGGETVEENLQTLCAVCNIGKSDEEF